MSLEAAKCPCCGAAIQIPDDQEKTYCAYCGSQIITKAAIAFAKVKIVGAVEVKGINTADKLIKDMDTLRRLGDTSAFDILEKFIKEYPSDWRGWWRDALWHSSNDDMQDRLSSNKSYKYALQLADDANVAEMRNYYADYINALNKRVEMTNQNIYKLQYENPMLLNHARRDGVNDDDGRGTYIEWIGKQLYVIRYQGTCCDLFPARFDGNDNIIWYEGYNELLDELLGWQAHKINYFGTDTLVLYGGRYSLLTSTPRAIRKVVWAKQGLCAHCGSKIGFFGYCTQCKRSPKYSISVNHDHDNKKIVTSLHIVFEK